MLMQYRYANFTAMRYLQFSDEFSVMLPRIKLEKINLGCLMFGIKFNSQMFIAWRFTSLYMLCTQLIQLSRPNEIAIMKIAIITVCILNGCFFVYLVRVLRGPNKFWQDKSENAEKLSTWGYFWRAYIVHIVAIPIILILVLVFSVDLSAAKSSPIHLVLANFLYMLSASVGAWIIFSTDRRGQLKSIFAVLRGF